MSKTRGAKCISQHIPCPVVDCQSSTKEFANQGSLKGHLRFYHGLKLTEGEELIPYDEETNPVEAETQNPETGKSTPLIPSGPVSPGNKGLRAEVERLALLKKKQELLGVPLQPGVPDASETAGLGAMTEATREALQGKAFGISGQQLGPQAQLREGLEIQKLIQEVAGNNKGGGILSELKDLAALLGISGGDVKNFLFNRGKPVASTDGNGLKLGGVNLSVAEVSDSTLQRLIDRDSQIESAKIEAGGKQAMADSLGSVFKTIGKAVADGLLEGEGNGAGADDVTQKPPERKSEPSEPMDVACPGCGEITVLDVRGANLGDTFTLECSSCGHTERDFQLVEPETKKKGAKPRVQMAVPAEPSGLPDIIVCECSQQLCVPSDAVAGQWLPCPVCGRENVVGSDKPVLPGQPPGEQKRDIAGGERRE